MYEGLPIATNKIRPEERKGIPHHLLGCVKVDEEPWTVKQFRDRASEAIEAISSRGKLPILVGGTHYYTQSLLLNNTVTEQAEPHDTTGNASERGWPILESTGEEMLEELRKVDPIMANHWHPNDRRKIRRSLEIWLKTGKKASDVYKEQKMNKCTVIQDESAENLINEPQSALRYQTLILWTYASPDILSERLAQRVDKMVGDGLLDEIESMNSLMQDQARRGKAVDQSRGIWVAIGFKELLPFILSDKGSTTLRQEGIKCTKIATRQYAKRQIRWIRLKLQRAINEAGASRNLFLIDATDAGQWHATVKTAEAITSAFLGGDSLPNPQSLSKAAQEMLIMTKEAVRTAKRCEACSKTLMSEQEWTNHLKSKGHRGAVRQKVDWEALYPKHGLL